VSEKTRLGVLVSGSGSNLQALIDACAGPEYPVQIAAVISSNASARALRRAEDAKLPAFVLEPQAFPTRDSFEQSILVTLEKQRVQLVCLAGFMRILGPAFLRSFPGQVLNIHPALLPAFPGLHAVRQALAHGVKIAGCTVHFVDQGTDTGPIIVQAAVPVLPGDDEASLAARILAEEHRIYPLAVRWVAQGAVSLQGRVVQLRGEPEVSDRSIRNPGRTVP
jgi:phosphoribosylglycinamide formyltransferase 1